jgi:hypothetical protein
MNILGVLFALTLAFIGNDTWTAHDRAVMAVNAEADSLRGLAIIIRQLPPQAQQGAREALQAYAGGAVAEWSDLGRREVSAATSEAAAEVLGSLTSPALISALPEPAANSALGLAMQIRQSRDERIALSQTHVNPLKWLGMAFLGLLTMISVAAVHIGAPRAMILSVSLFALAVAPTAVIVLIHGNPSRVLPQSPKRQSPPSCAQARASSLIIRSRGDPAAHHSKSGRPSDISGSG